jgi:antitoxin ChpS
MEAKLTKVGNSIGFMIPSVLRRSMQLEAGQSITIEETADGLLMRPVTKHRYTLTDLISQCHPKATMSKDIKDWDSATPTGNEVW